MSEQTLQTNLNQIGPLDLLLGDINTRFQHNTPLSRRGPTSNPSPRASLFQTWAVNTNMVHIQDPSEYSTSHTIPDHVFAAIQHQPNIALSLVSTQSLSFQTDHRFLCMLNLTTQPHPLDPLHLRSLQHLQPRLVQLDFMFSD